MKSIKKIMITLCATFIILTNIIPADAKVKVINKRLYANKVYTSYDITGDNKKDRIALKFTDSKYDYGEFLGYTELSIYINKKLAYRFAYHPKSPYYFSDYEVRYIRLSNNKKFIFFKETHDLEESVGFPCTDDSFILEYKNKKLKKVTKSLWALPHLSNYQSVQYMHSDTLQSITVKGNSIIVESDLGFRYMPAYFITRTSYTYKKGKLRQSSTGSIKEISRLYVTDVNYLTANRKMQVYKDTKLKKKYFTIKRNQHVRLLKFGGTYKKYWFKVKVGKKVGYLKAHRYGEYNEDTYLFYDEG